MIINEEKTKKMGEYARETVQSVPAYDSKNYFRFFLEKIINEWD